MAAFILGTFDQIELKRQRNGRVELTTRWRVFFFTRPATRIRLKDYEGFTTGVENKSAFFSWLFLLMFLGYGILPGILWWYCYAAKEIQGEHAMGNLTLRPPANTLYLLVQ